MYLQLRVRSPLSPWRAVSGFHRPASESAYLLAGQLPAAGWASGCLSCQTSAPYTKASMVSYMDCGDKRLNGTSRSNIPSNVLLKVNTLVCIIRWLLDLGAALLMEGAWRNTVVAPHPFKKCSKRCSCPSLHTTASLITWKKDKRSAELRRKSVTTTQHQGVSMSDPYPEIQS